MKPSTGNSLISHAPSVPINRSFYCVVRWTPPPPAPPCPLTSSTSIASCPSVAAISPRVASVCRRRASLPPTQWPFPPCGVTPLLPQAAISSQRHAPAAWSYPCSRPSPPTSCPCLRLFRAASRLCARRPPTSPRQRPTPRQHLSAPAPPSSSAPAWWHPSPPTPCRFLQDLSHRHPPAPPPASNTVVVQLHAALAVVGARPGDGWYGEEIGMLMVRGGESCGWPAVAFSL
jgi:hypothetical protein